MTSEQISGQVRILLGALAAYLVGKGWLPGGYVVDFVAVGVVVAMVIWSHLSHSLTAMIEAVAASPDIKKIYTTPSLAIAVPSIKVVATP